MRSHTKFRLLTATSILAAMLGLATSKANAQVQAGQADQGDIVVTGTAAVVKDAGAIKQSQQAIVDSITANELDKLPDVSVADALERVVGVSTAEGFQSAAGRTVTIRGFDARYNSMDVDGNPIWNASRNNRGTQLDIFPASVVSQINVYKTPTPDMDANSIGGHVELRTLRAFDGGGQPYLSVKAEAGGYSQSGLNGNVGPSYLISAVAKRTFGADHQLGIVLGGEYQESHLYEISNSVGSYAVVNGVDVVNDSMFAGRFNETIKRKAVYGKLEAGRPDHLYGFLSAAYYQMTDFQANARSGPFLTAKNVTGVATDAGTFANVPDEAYDERYDLNRQTILIGSGLDYAIGRNQALSFRAGYTRYIHNEADYVGERFEAPTVSGSYDISDGGFGAAIPSSTAVANAANWAYRNKKPSTITQFPDRDNVYSAKLDYDYNTQPGARGFGVEAGLYWQRLDRHFDETQLSYMLPTATKLNLGQVLAGGVNSASALGPNIIDDAAFWNFIQTQGTLSVNPLQTADYDLKEDVAAAHATFFYTTDRLKIMAGARVEKTWSDDRTGNTQNGAIVPIRNQYSYTNPLPNVQIQYDLTAGLRAKFAFTETIARPDFQDYAMGRTVTTDVFGNTVISGTNPKLQPRESNNYDLDLEYYFHGGFASIGLFRKDLRHEEFKQLTNVTNDAGNIVLQITQPLNTGSGTVNGLEAAFRFDRMDFLPKPLDGLSFGANFTRLIGRWDVVFTDGSTRTVGGLRNQPTYLANVNLGYALGRFSINAAMTFRGKMFTGTFGTDPTQDVYYRPYASLSLDANYRLTRGVRLFFQASNLNGGKKEQYTGSDAVLTNAIWVGPSFKGGVKFKL